LGPRSYASCGHPVNLSSNCKKFEPLLLLPIGFGALLSNIPGANLAIDGGILHLFYVVGIESGAFPLIIFMGVGALTDFGPLLANPKTLLLGAAAQFGIFATLLGAVGLSVIGVFDFSLKQAAAIGIIGVLMVQHLFMLLQFLRQNYSEQLLLLRIHIWH
jgi:Na+-transporting methylmalonyl-CoA/oxaloacetate decarboxylase beta subunit